MIATAVLAADYAGTLDLSETTIVRARATQGQDPALDFVEMGEADIRFRDRISAYALTLSPMLTLPGFPPSGSEESVDPQLLTAGSASAAWRYRSTSFTLTEGAMYGLINSANLTPTATGGPSEQPVVAAVPRPQTLTILGSTTEATFRQGIGRRIELALSAAYLVSGGADMESRQLLPEEYGPRAVASLAYKASRIDLLTTRAIVREIRTTGQCPPPATTGICAERTESAQLDETFSHSLFPTMVLSAGAGAAAYDMDALDAGIEATILYPVVFAQFSDRFGFRGASELAFYAQIAPNVDPLTGYVAEYFQASGNLTDVVTSSLTVHLGVSGLATVTSSEALIPGSDDGRITVLSGSSDVTFRLDREIDLALGAQGLWQDHAGYGRLWSAFGYVSLTVRAPRTRL